MKHILLLLMLFMLASPLCAQTMSLQKIEKDLQQSYQKISGNGYPNFSDSIEIYNSSFRQKIAYYTSHFPKTLDYKFSLLTHNTELNITTSKNHLFRIYSWDRYDGGTMHAFDNLFQFKSDGKVYSKLSADTLKGANYEPGVFYTKIYQLKTALKTYYLALGGERYSTSLGGTRVKVFAIKKHTLNDTLKLIKTKKGKWVNSLNSVYNMLSNYPGGRFPNGVEYDKVKKTLSIPVVAGDNDSLTTRSDIYQFNGAYFKYIKTTNK